MIDPEPVATVDDMVVHRWCDARMPEGLGALIDAATTEGIDWIGDFPGEWRRRPFLDDGEGLFLATLRETIVGMAVISADPHVPDQDTGRLRFIFVAETARGCGLMGCFVTACLSRGAARWRRIRLHTDNPVAALVYERHGFVPVANESRSTHTRGNHR